MKTSVKHAGAVAALVLAATVCLLVFAAPVLAWWPMSGHPVAMPFGGQTPTEMSGAVLVEPGDLDALWAGLDPGTTYYDTPRAGEQLMLHWRYAAQWYAATGPFADLVTGYVLFDWNDIERSAATANTHWGTNIVTSVDPRDYWPLLPPRSTWLWAGRYQGVTFTSWGWGMHVLQEKWTGCNENHGLSAYVTWAFDNPWDVHGQAWVVRGHRN
jgi:hypothetical protein